MARVRYNSKIDEELLSKAKERAVELGLVGANEIVEDALRLYFANCLTEVWEKPMKDGWIKKLVVRPGKVTFECIRSRKIKEVYNPQYFSPDVLEPKGFSRVWKMKHA